MLTRLKIVHLHPQIGASKTRRALSGAHVPLTKAKIRKLGKFDAPQLRNRTSYRKVDQPVKLPGDWTTTWSKQYLSAVHPMTCSLLWVGCLFDRLRQIFDFQIFGFWHPDYDPDRGQKLISSSMSRHLSTRKISSKSMHAFLSNLANRQTDRQTSRAIASTSSFVGANNWKLQTEAKLNLTKLNTGSAHFLCPVTRKWNGPILPLPGPTLIYKF